jgi:hypothetical protein
VTGLLLLQFAYLVLLSVISDGVGGVLQFLTHEKDSVLLGQKTTKIIICAIIAVYTNARRRIIEETLFHSPSTSTKTTSSSAPHDLPFDPAHLGTSGFSSKAGCFKPPKRRHQSFYRFIFSDFSTTVDSCVLRFLHHTVCNSMDGTTQSSVSLTARCVIFWLEATKVRQNMASASLGFIQFTDI